MQNSPDSSRKSHGQNLKSKSETDQYSFTSFTPLSSESTKGSFSLAKLFQWKSSESKAAPKSRGIEAASNTQAGNEAQSKNIPTLNQGRSSPSTLRSKIPRSWSSPRFQRQQGSSLSGSPGQGKQLPQGYRNLSALFKRLSAVADYSKGDQPSQPYKESHFRQYWMPDENCKECYECGEKFNTFRRRHHCRLCGQIFCYRCCNIEIPGEIMGYSGGLRVCTYCNKIFQTYTQSPDMLRNLEQLQADIQAVSMDTDYSLPHSSSLNTLNLPRTGISFEEDDKFYSQPSLPNSRKTSSGSSSNSVYFEKLEQREGRPSTTMQSVRSPFDAFGVCAAEANMLKQDSLREIWHTIMSKRSGLELQSHRFRLKTYQNCFVATDLVEWLITHEKAMTRVQAAAIGQALLESGWLESVPQTRDVHDFSDEYALYQPGPVALKDQAAGNPRSSKFFSDSKLKDVLTDENSENENEADDETAPQWFRQLPGYESGEELDVGESVQADPVLLAGISSVPKHSRASGAKLLDLDVTTAVEEEESELNLKVNLDHFCEGNTGASEGQNTENQGPTLSLTTDVPPPPLEQYVYTEGYPITSLRASYYKKASETAALATSAEDVLKGAMMARRIGVDRPKLNDPKALRDDNNERLAMERICKARVIHVSRLVEQLLKDAGLSLEWKDIILPLVEEISEKVAPDVRKDDDMDIRQYVKFKKIPGGRKEDCEVVWGVGFTKNVSNKKMSSSFSNPRILVLCCAIDYQRKENRLASLDPLILQENEFLKNFVARIASLRPNVLLVEKTVSRLAQDMLLQYGITLALNVKPEVIERVARCTKANILRSMEQLSRPQLGTCQQFRVQKYILKNGEAKTLMFFDGCPPELGCTVSLRGGNSLVLAKVKKIVQFVTYVSYSQRLETAFLMDEFALPEEPEQFYAGVVSSTTNNAKCSQETTKEDGEMDSDLAKEESSDEAGIFQQALGCTVLSSSPYVKYPLPYLLTPEGYRCAVRSRLPKEIYWSARLTNENHTSHLTEKELDEFELRNLKRNVNKGVQILEAHPLVWSRVVINSSDQFIQGIVADFRSQGGRIQLKRRNNIESNGRRKSKWLMLDVDGMEKEKRNNAPDGNTRESDEKKNQKIKPDDVKFNEPATPIHFNRKIDCLDPNYHQRIAVLFSSYSSESNNSPRPCISPWAVFMEFYGRNDITLGGFLERYCFRPSYVCPNPNCDVPMVDHVRYFAHGSGSVYIHMKNLESPIPGFQHTILTWSWCKECKQVTPIVPLSSDAWALSFAKYIELRFYADEYTRRASVEPCDHSLHRLHYQYFAYANMVASFKYRAIKLYETAIPPPSISVKDEVRDATYWVLDVKAISTRGDTVFASILERIDTFKLAKIEFHAPERDSKLAQFTVQLEEDHVRFTEQVQIVEKKVKVLQSLQNPQGESSYDHLDQRDQQALGYVIADSVNGLKRILCEAVDNWNHRLQEFIQVEKKRNNKAGNQRDAKTGDKLENGLSARSVDDFRDLTEDLNPSQFVSAAPGLSPAFSPWNSRNVSPFVPSEGSDSDLESQVSDVDTSKRDMYFNPIVSADDASKNDDKRGEFEESLTQKENPEGVGNNLKNEDSLDQNEVSQGNERKNGRMPFVRGHRRIMSYPPQINVTVGGASFEAMDRQTVENVRVIKSGNGLARSFSDTNICIIGKHTEEDKSLLEISIKSSPSVPVMQKDSPGASDLVKTSKPPVSMSEASTKKNTEQDSPASIDGAPAVRRRDKMKNIISSFLPGSAFQPVASSFPSHEHHLLPPGEKVLVVVSEKEPSSIIAYALSTKEYNTRLCEIQAGLARLTKGTNAIPQESVTDNNQKSPQQFNDSCEEFGDRSTVSSMISLDEDEGDFVNVEIRDLTEIEKDSSTEYVEIIEDIQDSVPVRIKRGSTLERQDRVKFSKAIQEKQPEVKGQSVLDDPENIHKNCDEMQEGSDLSSLSEFGFQPDLAGKGQTMEFHIQMQFSYNVCRFYCNAYYAEQFRKLRKHIFTDGEERYIRSLAHCVDWRARGGKSGSSFSKSLDDRFVLKQMSRLELQSFVEFAPHYFQYMNKAIKEKRSTLLAKIFGVYRIGFKNTQTNTTMRQDVLVMENLFYDRKIDKIFDLKGSMRSRYVQVSGRENDVLMDENLLEMIREDPIFIRPHSKAVLSKAIHNDTEFLAHHMVMDYSLLVGIDELRSELVTGIIDFIRTFTWDKKLEMYVKSSGILGGQGKMPTVVSPELYRTRFSEAMQRYFLMVPDKWTGLGNDLD